MLTAVLSAVIIHIIVILINKLADRHERIPPIFQCGENKRQSLGGMQPVVVAKYDRAVFCSIDDAHSDFRSGKVFPVQGVHVPLNGVKPHLRAGVNKGVVVIPIGRAKEGHLLSRQLFYGLGGGGKLVLDLLFCEPTRYMPSLPLASVTFPLLMLKVWQSAPSSPRGFPRRMQ